MLSHVIMETPTITAGKNNVIINNGYRCDCGCKTFIRDHISIGRHDTWEISCINCLKKHKIIKPYNYI